jgi:hypothetical protein
VLLTIFAAGHDRCLGPTLAAHVLVSPFFYAKSAVEGFTMPSLFRFLTLIGVLGGLTYGAMFMLATWFDPKPREITVSIPPDRFAKQQQP